MLHVSGLAILANTFMAATMPEVAEHDGIDNVSGELNVTAITLFGTVDANWGNAATGLTTKCPVKLILPLSAKIKSQPNYQQRYNN